MLTVHTDSGKDLQRLACIDGDGAVNRRAWQFGPMEGQRATEFNPYWRIICSRSRSWGVFDMDKVNICLVEIYSEYRGRPQEEVEAQTPGGEENASE